MKIKSLHFFPLNFRQLLRNFQQKWTTPQNFWHQNQPTKQ